MPTISAKAKSCSVSPPKKYRREHRQQRAEAGRQRAHHDLGHRAVDDLREGRARHARDVLAHAVEHDDRVVEREAQDGEQRRDRRRRHLPAGEGVDAARDQEVVQQRDQHRHRDLPLEAQRDVDRDDGQRGDDRDQRRARHALAEGRADRLRRRARRRSRTPPRARCWAASIVSRPAPEEIWTTLSPSSWLSIVWISASARPGPADARRAPGRRWRACSSGAVIRVPPSKSMPKFRPLPAIANAPISMITPEAEKNHFEAPM